MKLLLYPKGLLEAAWRKDKKLYADGDAADPPRCLRCGAPLAPHLMVNALSRYVDVQICEACGMDEALRDAAHIPLPLEEWDAIKQGTWHDERGQKPAPELAKEIDEFQSALFKLPAFKTLETMRRFCRYAQPTNEATEFNLYSETDHLYIWVRLITRFRDYNVYVHYYDKNYQ